MYEYLILSSGLIFMVTTSCIGTCMAMTSSSINSIMLCQKRSIIPKAYISLILTSTIFMYCVILSLIIVPSIKTGYELSQAFNHFLACVIYGSCGLAAGIAMETMAKHGFVVIKSKPSFFLYYILMMSSIEVLLIFGVVMALLLIVAQ